MATSIRKVKSAERVLEVLEVFAALQRPLSAPEIMTHLGYPQSSTVYLLRSLCESGYLNYNKIGKSFFPTSKVRNVGSWIEGHLPENTIIFDVMRRLRHRFSETVAVGTQSDLYLQYLKAIESDHPVRYHIADGNRRLLLEAAMGRMLISEHSDAQIDTICRRTNQVLNERRYDPEQVRVVLKGVRRAAVCSMEDVGMPYAAATIAMRLPSLYNGQPLVIGIGGRLERISSRTDEIVSALREELKAL